MRIMEVAENVTPEERLSRMDQLLNEMLELTENLPEINNVTFRKENIPALSESRD